MMTDDTEARIRAGLGQTPLPAAPESLRGYLADLSLDVQPSRRSNRPHPRSMFLGAAAILILALAMGTVFLNGSVPAVSPAPTDAPTSPTASPVEPQAGFRTFEAPGIRFEHPADWIDQSGVVDYPSVPGTRFLAFFARGFSLCPISYAATATPSPEPGSCEVRATAPGSLTLTVVEYTKQLPGLEFPGAEMTEAGYPVWEQSMSADPADPASFRWALQAPDGGLYLFSAEAPRAELAALKTDIGAVLASLRLSAWETPPESVNGQVHLDLPQGFSFDYPAGWTLYYPQDMSTVDLAIVTVASMPVEPPCVGDLCQRFTTPPGTIVIEFRAGNGPTAPNWSDAPTTLGGQPAFRQDWGPQNATGAEEGHSWSARLTDPLILGVYVSLRGPGLPELRAAMNDVLESIHITRNESPGP
jgi:hypothetical protein